MRFKGTGLPKLKEKVGCERKRERERESERERERENLK